MYSLDQKRDDDEDLQRDKPSYVWGVSPNHTETYEYEPEEPVFDLVVPRKHI